MRFSSFALALVAVLATGANAWLYKDFPYCRCIRQGPFSFDKIVDFKGDNEYCFTINVDFPVAGCDNRCCVGPTDLRKVEFDVEPECMAPGYDISATINGKPTKRPVLYHPDNTVPGTTLLRLIDLGLTVEDDGSILCLKFNAGPCTTLQEFCKPPAGGLPGDCKAALFDTNKTCCPITETGQLPPPPPPPPAVCDQSECFTLELSPPTDGTDTGYRFNRTTCTAVRAALAANFTVWAADNDVTVGDFTIRTCTATRVQVCTPLKLQTLTASAELQAAFSAWQTPFFLEQIVGSWCQVGYFLGFISTGCLSAEDNHRCSAPFLPPPPTPTPSPSPSPTPSPTPPPWPYCKCQKRPYSTPFILGPNVTELDGKPGRTLYCFTTEVIKTNTKTPCGKTTTLSKAEFFANENRKRSYYGAYVYKKGATKATFVAPSWGSKGQNTLRVGNINFSKTSGNGGRICLELATGTSLSSFCLRPAGTPSGVCWASLWDEGKKCCPISHVDI